MPVRCLANAVEETVGQRGCNVILVSMQTWMKNLI
jgi:hypothetical protein